MNATWTMLRRKTRRDLDTRRAQRITQVLEIVEQFVYDLGLLISGESVDLAEYVATGCAERLQEAVRPALTGGAMTRPDFGEFAQVHIEGDLLDLSLPVSVVVEFEDRSTRLDADGIADVGARRRVRLQLLLDDMLSQVLDHRIGVVA